MSLVTYDLSDSEDDVDDTKSRPSEKSIESVSTKTNNINIIDSKSISLNPYKISDNKEDLLDLKQKNMFSILPEPKCTLGDKIVEEDDILIKNENLLPNNETPDKKTRVQITVPSMSEFKDVEEIKNKRHEEHHTSKRSNLFSRLPPPKSEKLAKSLIPQILKKKPPISKPQIEKRPHNVKRSDESLETKMTDKASILVGSNYDTESEDEEDCSSTAVTRKKLDFFSLSTSGNEISNADLAQIQKETEEMTIKYLKDKERKDNSTENLNQPKQNLDVNQPGPSSTKSLFNLPREDILIKNKIDVGPKLPVPEQDYNLDSKGNIAFDNKAIQYLCGKRGMKRKNEELDSVNIIEINGEDIKPDEREWLVKALTENPIHRPVSLGSGPGGQSKKKHQITYLAHQAKAMELELQNQWSQNRMTRKQTQSKYGF